VHPGTDRSEYGDVAPEWSLVTWPEMRDMLSDAAQQPGHPYIDTITATDTPCADASGHA
jgi:hypothetical protein